MTLLQTARVLIFFIAIFLCASLNPLPAVSADAQTAVSKQEDGSSGQQQWANSAEESLHTLQLQIVSIVRHELSFTGRNNWPEYLPGYRVELQRRYDMFTSEGDRLLEILAHPPARIEADDLGKMEGLLQTLEGQAVSLSKRRFITARAAKPVLPPGCDFSKARDMPDCSPCCTPTTDDPVSLISTSRNCGVCRVLNTVYALKDSFRKLADR